jgi:TolB-like protein/Flp pilus assembly protein TadD
VARGSHSLVRFGVFEVDLDLGEVRKQGMKVKLHRQPFEILAKLLARAGEVVTREELRKQLWPGNTFVDFEHSLATAIGKIRESLGDSVVSPRFVETVPRTGYRFIAPLETVESFQVFPRGNGKIRLAVLPFENLSADPEQEYFSDGLTEEMISQLGQLNPKRLSVIARTSSMKYKRAQKSIEEIGRELNVEYILEGTVRRSASRLRITAQLIHVRDQIHLWAESYDRHFEDIFSVQQEVARKVAASLILELLPEHTKQPLTMKPSAYEAYLRGRYSGSQWDEDGLKTAIGWFQEALVRDTEFALAYSGIADCYSMLGWFGALASQEAGQKARSAATRAVELHEWLGEAHASLALVRLWYDWDWPGAEIEFQRAIALNPNSALVHHWYALFLNVTGRTDEATAEQHIAQELDPLSLTIALNTADAYYFGRQYDQAIERLRSVLNREPQFAPAYFNLGRVYTQKRMFQEAIGAFEKAMQLSGNHEAMPALAHALALAGATAEPKAILEQLKSVPGDRHMPSPLIALIYLGLGEKEGALQWLERGLAERSCWLIFLKMDPVYDELRSDRRYSRILQLMGFPLITTVVPKESRAA